MGNNVTWVGAMPPGFGLSELVEPAFLESTVQQAALLLRASGSGFYVRDPVKNKLELAATYNLGE